MILWTIQTPEVYTQILNEGVYICEKEKAPLLEDEEFQKAYEWLTEKMEQKIGHSDAKYPVWAWYIADGKHKKPDLRFSGYGERGQELVCLEIEIPDEKVVLSDFDLWHFVLGDMYLFDEDEEFEDLEDLPEEKKEASWDKVFVSKDSIAENTYIQATFWELRKEDVRKVQFFRAR